jgi:uncharacterized protein YneF (UPF0154 family)
MSGAQPEKTSSVKKRQWGSDLFILLGTLGAFTTVGVIALVVQKMGRAHAALVCGVAFLAVGLLIGFLFGIPRVLQKELSPVLPSPQSTTLAGYRIQVNTNLEQISDWLTKIIVGLGLVELHAMPSRLRELARFLSGGMQASMSPEDVHSAEVLALLTVVYFTLIGFFGGYLLTRTYLTGAFRRADEENLELLRLQERLARDSRNYKSIASP